MVSHGCAFLCDIRSVKVWGRLKIHTNACEKTGREDAQEFCSTGLELSNFFNIIFH
jgi:hypothetical protein